MTKIRQKIICKHWEAYERHVEMSTMKGDHAISVCNDVKLHVQIADTCATFHKIPKEGSINKASATTITKSPSATHVQDVKGAPLRSDNH